MEQVPVISTTDLSYHYSRHVQTLHNINLKVERGSIYGFLGPNGSGKTTTLSLLLGLLKSKQGQINIFGESLHSNRIAILKKTGSLIENPALYGHLTAVENLRVYSKLYDVNDVRIQEVLTIVGLTDVDRKLVKRFSLGMKQRLAIALALLPNPELLILDEPSNGLDPAGIIELRELMKKLNRDHGMTILISSHLLAEVEKMVTHLGIIVKGKMLFQGTLRELHSFQAKGARLMIQTSDDDKAFAVLREYSPQRLEDSLSVAFAGKESVASINRLLTAKGLDIYLLHPKENDLEQLFIDLTSSN
jgi:ABC-type multidrug transport system ATPase subunit